jgi:hypothetical protein
VSPVDSRRPEPEGEPGTRLLTPDLARLRSSAKSQIQPDLSPAFRSVLQWTSWEDRLMRCTAENLIFHHPPISKRASPIALPLIPRPLNFCFPHHRCPLAVKAGHCIPYVQTNRCPGGKEVNTSQKKCENGKRAPSSSFMLVLLPVHFLRLIPLLCRQSVFISGFAFPSIAAPSDFRARQSATLAPSLFGKALPFGKHSQNPQPLASRQLTPTTSAASHPKIKKGKRDLRAQIPFASLLPFAAFASKKWKPLSSPVSSVFPSGSPPTLTLANDK